MRLFKRKNKLTLSQKLKWNDLSVGDLIKIKTIDQLQMATPDEKNLRVAALLAGIDYEQLLNIPLDDVKEYVEKATFLLTEPKPIKARRTYVINGRKYKLLKNEMDMLTSQFIDFQAVYRDGFEKRPGELLSIMMVPAGHEYNDGYDKDQVISDMYDMKVEEALGIVSFFTRRFVRLFRWTKTYYKWRMWLLKKMARKEDREMVEAAELQLKLIMQELDCIFGSLVLKRSVN